jgi:hypothetical protein
MADSKLTQLNEIGAALVSTDIFYVVDDPGGTPLSRKATMSRVSAFVAGKQTMWIPATRMTGRTTNGAAATTREINSITLPFMAFDAATDEAAQFTVAFPKSWNEGTVTAQAFWTVAGGNGAETIELEVSGGCFANDAAINSTGLGTAVALTDTWLANGDVHVTAESSAITLSNAAVDTVAVFQILRDVSEDTLTGDLELIGIKLFYTTDATNDA